MIRRQPAPHSRTKVLSHSLKVSPSNHFVNLQQDPYGNFLARFVSRQPLTQLKIEVDIVDDGLTENRETFGLVLRDAAGATVVDGQGAALMCADVVAGSEAPYTAQDLDASDPDAITWKVDVEVDLTSVDILETLRAALAGRGIRFALARVKFELRQQLQAAGFVQQGGEEFIFATLPTAVAAYADWYQRTRGERPPGVPAQRGLG